MLLYHAEQLRIKVNDETNPRIGIILTIRNHDISDHVDEYNTDACFIVYSTSSIKQKQSMNLVSPTKLQ